nr:retrovirus-related Pol polyprotein from transposon TNT 1-94 [Tanacetum cinerariifolium]
VSLSACCAQVLWMRTQLTDYGFHFDKILIYCDSKSAIAISCNPVQHSRTKHSAFHYHFIKEHVEKGTIELYFVKTDYQLADIFTKALPADCFNYLVRRLGMRSLSPQELDRLAKSQSKDEAPEVIIKFLKRITILLQSLVIIIRTDNGTEFKNQVLKEYFDTVGISHQMSSVRTPQKNGVVERRNRTLVEAARTMLIFSRAPLFLWAEAIVTACFTQNRSIIHCHFNKTPYELINGRKPDISFLYVFGALCYPENDREDIGKLGAKGDIGFFIGYSADSYTYRVYNRRTKKIMETMNVSFDELSAMAFEQRSSKPRLQTTARTVPPAQEPQVRQTSTASTTIADTASIPTNSSSLATNFPVSSQDVDELNPNAIVDGNMFFNPSSNSSTSAAASSSQQNMDPSNMHTSQLRSDGDMCMYALTAKPTEKHLKEVKRIFRYLRGTVNTGLWYTKDSGFELTEFSDADYAGCKDTFKSTFGGAQFLGEKVVSWSSKKQDCTALSTAEAEYVSLSACCAQVLWMRTQSTNYGFHFIKSQFRFEISHSHILQPGSTLKYKTHRCPLSFHKGARGKG